MTREERENAIRCLKLWIEREPYIQTYKTCLEALEQEPKYCDRNICLRNEYNGIGCEECEVTKSKELYEDAVDREQVNDILGHCIHSQEDYYLAIKMLNELPSVKQEPKADIRECGSCKHSKDGHMAGTEECHECMWDNKYEQEPCDAISRQAVLDYIYNDLGLGDEENGKDVERQMELESSYKYIKLLPPVQPKTGGMI